MARLGIATGFDLKCQSLPFLQQHFGKFGAYLFDVARGIDNRAVRANRIRKSVGAEHTFSEDIHSLEEAKTALVPIIEKVATICQKRMLIGRTITLKVKYADFESITRRQTIATAINDIDSITTQAYLLLAPIFLLSKSIRLLGVSMSSFETDYLVQDLQLQFAI